MVIHAATNYLSENDEIGIGVSDHILLSISIVGFTTVLYFIYSIWKGHNGDTINDTDVDNDGLTENERLLRADVHTLNRTQRRVRAKMIMKEQRRIQQPQQQIPNPDEVGDERIIIGAENNNGNNDQLNDGGNEIGNHRILGIVPSRKERQQAAKEAEKEERRLFQEERERQQRIVQEEAQRQKLIRSITVAQKLEEEQKRKEMERFVREEKARELWSTFIPLLDKSDPLQRQRVTVTEFLEECHKNRIVDIEAMAFKYDVQPCIIVDRIKQLLSENRIAGYFTNSNNDNHRCFTYISDDELSSIATSVRDHKYVSLTEFATICKQIIER